MEEEIVTSGYFEMIHDRLFDILIKAPWAIEVYGQILLLQMDLKFLREFCLYLESWDYTITDEESKEILISMITTLTVIWLKGLKSWAQLPTDMSIEDFHSASIELEAKIQQSKQHVESWCINLMNSSVQCWSLTFFDIRESLERLRKSLDDFSKHRADKIVPLEKQIDLLKNKIVFLEETLNIVECCQDEEEILQFLDFIGDFANRAACLTRLYWAKEDNEETATEMYIAIFDMLQKSISSAYDITALYIGILKSYKLQPSDSFTVFSKDDVTPLYIDSLKSYNLQPSDSFLLGEAVASFVHFFFEHLATTLMDDFLILRDHLIFLFTFLIDPPCENAEVEELIRSQIYALLREDAYLLLPFDKIKEDFSDKKMLLRDCVIKIDITIVKIRQLYCEFSDSWIRMEVEKMEYTYYVSVRRELSLIEKHAQWADSVQGQLQLYRMELKFLRMFILCFATWDDTDEEIRVRLTSMIASLQGIWEKEKGLFAPRLHAMLTGGIKDWQPLASEFEGKIKLSKLEIKAWWVNLFRWSFRCRPSTSHEIVNFVDSILDNLNDLASCKACENLTFKKQIETLEDKLVFLKNLLKLAANCKDSKGMREFNMFVQIFANDAACLTFVYWAKDKNDEIVSETNSMISHMLQKIKPATPDVARLYFETLNTIYVQRSDSLMFGHSITSFVDLFLGDLMPPLKDGFQILRDDIIFLLSFLNDPPNENAAESICSQIDVLFWEGVNGLLPFDDKEEDFSKKIVLLSGFMMKIESVNATIRQIYGKFPDSSHYNFPKVISPGFLDFLIQNLRNLKERMSSDHKYVPFAKYKIVIIEEELVSLCPFFNHIFDLQSELNETLFEVVDLVQLIEHVISSCISSWFMFDHPIWYHMAYLSDVFDRIKVVKTKFEKFKENNMYNARCLPADSAGFVSTPLVGAIVPSKINEIVIGFEDEAEKIIGNLIRGRMALDIVSIVGMGGLGKTTLAKKVYESSLVKCNFHVFAFCYVSRDYNTRRLLIDIISDINGIDDRHSKMTDDDLKHELWKCLSRQKYLIVLDDIWNVSSWNEIKSSFPNDKNGSRLMLTTRDCEVADMCKINCCPHQLRFLSEVESWDLLQRKVFQNGISPPYLHEIGKLIAKSCKGLPLAVTVIAGLLARTEKNVKWWSEVAERVVSYLSDEGCIKILELSYIHLPKKLKPCLLYLGAFPEDMVISVKQVTLLWIAEGFIQESKPKIIENVAREHFNDLVARSFIIVTGRSSDGEIKTFRVHDLIHELCQRKCRDMNFFRLDHGIASSSSSNPSINNYRVSIHEQNDVTKDDGSSLSNTRSLLSFSEKTGRKFTEFRLAQVLKYYGDESDMVQLSSLVHLRHIDVVFYTMSPISIPSSISTIWNIGSLILTAELFSTTTIHLPETFWRMKSLRHVKVTGCILKFLDGHEHAVHPKLDKMISFSKPILSTGKELQHLLQRLPVVRRLSCILVKPFDNDGLTLDFHRELESLTLTTMISKRTDTYLIHFPSTLKKLTLEQMHLPCVALSAIAKLHCLQVLKLRWVSFPEQRLEMEDVTFQNLKFFGLHVEDLVEWNASTESLPCLEQLLIKYCRKLEELPPCLEEISTLKRIVITESLKVESSALRIRDELMELGHEVQVSINNSSERGEL